VKGLGLKRVHSKKPWRKMRHQYIAQRKRNKDSTKKKDMEMIHEANRR